MTIAAHAIRILDQGLGMLEILDDETYRTPGGPEGPDRGAPYRRASVGAHLRHAIDYFRCFLRGLEGRRIDYDGRERDTGIETRREVAAEAIRGIAAELERLTAADAETPVVVKVDAAAVAGDAPVWSRSSVARELQFLLSHTVHHYALIAMILRGFGVEPGEEFGVAPSTLEHHEATGVAAR